MTPPTAIIGSVATRPTDRRDVLPPFNNVESSTTSGMAIAAQLREAILSDYTDGEMIGSEDDLIVRFGVSRPTMRQAVRILQAEGLITVRRGLNGGMFARVPNVDGVSRSLSLLLRHRGATMGDLLVAISPISDEMIRCAAQNPDEAKRKRAAAIILALEPDESLEDSVRTLEAVHTLAIQIDSLVDNPVLSLVAQVMLNLLKGGLADGPRIRGPYYQTGRRFHVALAEAIAAGDAQEASRVQTDMYERILAWLP
jgi:GntR family transcriptional regulator, transcriptional repressor for pyruvate dehydrogenase complex